MNDREEREGVRAQAAKHRWERDASILSAERKMLGKVNRVDVHV